MSKFAKWLLICAGILIALAVLLVLGANMYLQSQLSRDKIERRFSRALHMPVQIDRITYTPWGGVEVLGVKSPQPAGFTGNFLEAQRFTAQVHLLPLFSRKLSISEIRLQQPQVMWFQTEKGNWRLPKAEEAPAKEKPETTAKEEQPAHEERPTDLPKEKRSDFTVQIGNARLDGGRFQFLNRSGGSVFLFDGITAETQRPDRENLSGQAQINQLRILDTYLFDGVHSTFTYQNGVLKMPDLTASVEGGKLQGQMQLAAEQPGSPYSTSISFDQVDLARLLADAGSTVLEASGKITGKLDLQGNTKDRDSLKGAGHIQLDSGRIQQMAILSLLGSIFSIEELNVLELEKATGDFRIEDGKVWVDSLVLQSKNLRLSGTGKVKLNGKLDLNAQLAINDKVARQLPGMLRDHFVPVEGSDLRQIEFDIKGTLDKPKSNFVERVVGHDLDRQAGEFIRSLFGRKKSNGPAPGQSPAPGTTGTATAPATPPAPSAPLPSPGSSEQE